jgi:hypothetical protein
MESVWDNRSHPVRETDGELAEIDTHILDSGPMQLAW